MKPSETDLVRACLALLRAHGVVAWRQNTGAVPVKGGRFVRFGRVGCADITGILPGGYRLEIECKRPGGRLSKAQHEFLTMITQHGGYAWVVYSTEDLNSHLCKMEFGVDSEKAENRTILPPYQSSVSPRRRISKQ